MAITIDGDSGVSGVNGSATTPALQGTDSNTGIVFGTDEVSIATGGSTRATVDSSGNLLFKQEASSSPYPEQQLKWSNDSTTANGFFISQDSDRNGKIFHQQGLDILFGTNNSERMRITSNGVLGINKSSGFTTGGFAKPELSIKQTQTVWYGGVHLESASSSKLGVISNTENGLEISQSYRETSDGGAYKPIIFRTGGAQRMALDSSGRLMVGKTSASTTTNGGELRTGSSDYAGLFVATSHAPVLINRRTTDGVLVVIRQNDTEEGTISVSGSTVSYNGAHLSRWSQLAGGAERTEILRGSVLSNLDEMCEWAYEAQDAVLYTEEDELPEGVSVGDVKTPARDAGTEDNEQLNRMKVSDVEGDVNVAGVFQAWDDDDDTYTNDFYCAMTGDFVVRIAQGTTVARGDLLMSAGDGTAKPQDDDIVRSKTIAKVTSTTVSTTYSDGSYCVPCVLMAC